MDCSSTSNYFSRPPLLTLNKKKLPAPKQKIPSQNLDSDVDDYGPDLMGDDADREYLAGLNELEREMVLAERAERRETEVARRRTLRQRAIAAGTYKAPAARGDDDDEAAAAVAAKGPVSKKVQQRAALRQTPRDAVLRGHVRFAPDVVKS